MIIILLERTIHGNVNAGLMFGHARSALTACRDGNHLLMTQLILHEKKIPTHTHTNSAGALESQVWGHSYSILQYILILSWPDSEVGKHLADLLIFHHMALVQCIITAKSALISTYGHVKRRCNLFAKYSQPCPVLLQDVKNWTKFCKNNLQD